MKGLVRMLTTSHIISMIVLGTAFAFPSDMSYSFEPLRVKDGDTVEGKVEIWPKQYIVTSVRISGVNTPEIPHTRKYDACDIPKNCETVAGCRARKFVERFLSGKKVKLVNIQYRKTKYKDRINADLEVNGVLLSHELLRLGLGEPYNGEKRKPYQCTEEDLRELEAISR